jgi:hypothetical protein
MPKAKSKTQPPAAATAVAAWWLSDGDQECPHCGQLYIYELEFRCPDCDSPACSHCRKKHAENRDVCPECVSGDQSHG